MRLRGLFLGITPLLAACALIVGIDDKPLRVEAAVDAAMVDVAMPADPCVHAAGPGAPSADDDTSEASFTTAVRVFRFDDTSGPVGLDIDDSCTCQGGPGARNDAAPSCVGQEPRCDRDGGIDNALLDLPLLQLEAFRGDALTSEIGCGRGGLVLRLVGYNGRANDTNVGVAFLPSIGSLDPHEPGEPPAQCDAGALAGKSYKPRWDGTDRFNPDERYVQANQPIYVLKAYVRDFTVVAKATGTLPLPIGPLLADTVDARVFARITPLDAARNPITPITPTTRAENIRLEGVLAGRGSVSAMMKVVERTRLQGSFICSGTPFWDEVKASLCKAADVRANAAEDFKGQRCDGISLALGFIAEPAVQGGAAPASTTASPCADASATCE